VGFELDVLYIISGTFLYSCPGSWDIRKVSAC